MVNEAPDNRPKRLYTTRNAEIDAKILFHQFIGFLQQIMLNRKLADGALQGLKLARQFFALWRSA